MFDLLLFNILSCALLFCPLCPIWTSLTSDIEISWSGVSRPGAVRRYALIFSLIWFLAVLYLQCTWKTTQQVIQPQAHCHKIITVMPWLEFWRIRIRFMGRGHKPTYVSFKQKQKALNLKNVFTGFRSMLKKTKCIHSSLAGLYYAGDCSNMSVLLYGFVLLKVKDSLFIVFSFFSNNSICC